MKKAEVKNSSFLKDAKQLNIRELSTILFALRYLQEHYEGSDIEVSSHFNNDLKDGTTPLTVKEIDDLCATINWDVFYG